MEAMLQHPREGILHCMQVEAGPREQMMDGLTDVEAREILEVPKQDLTKPSLASQ